MEITERVPQSKIIDVAEIILYSILNTGAEKKTYCPTVKRIVKKIIDKAYRFVIEGERERERGWGNLLE